MTTQALGAPVMHGPLLRAFYAPLGSGLVLHPHQAGSIGTITAKPVNEKFAEVYSSYKFTAGYFFRSLQTELSYEKISAKNLKSSASNPATSYDINGKADFIELKLGKRFTIPGDPSYSFLYLSGKRMTIDLNHQDTKLECYGYLAGYHGFYSFDLGGDFELVLDLGLYAGIYSWSDLHTNIDLENNKNYSLSAGGSFGIGSLYEPFNTCFLIKACPEFDLLGYKSTYNGKSVNFNTGIFRVKVGFEIVYSIPSHSYNLKDRKKGK